MFETHRRKIDPSKVFKLTERRREMHWRIGHWGVRDPEEGYEEEEEASEKEAEWTDDDGEVFLLRPKRPVKARIEPGSSVATTRGIYQFRNIPHIVAPKAMEGRRVFVAGNLANSGGSAPRPFGKHSYLRTWSSFIREDGRWRRKRKAPFLADGDDEGKLGS